MKRTATAFAPATVANVAVGFDVLGFALATPGDRVSVERWDEAPGEIMIDSATGVCAVPDDPETNTAVVALRAMAADMDLRHGFRVRIVKGIPLSSGLGGSAASAVAAVVAANALFNPPLPTERLLPWALAGEAAASGAAHADNVAPCLYGGLCAALPDEHGAPTIVPLPVPEGVHCVLVHPQLQIDTKAARAVLDTEVPLAAHVRQSAHLAGFVAACFSGDRALLRRCLRDFLIEPQRSGRVPGFAAAQRAALDAGALGCSLSGSGPSLFAWVEAEDAAAVERALEGAFAAEGLAIETFSGPLGSAGARAEGS